MEFTPSALSFFSLRGPWSLIGAAAAAVVAAAKTHRQESYVLSGILSGPLLGCPESCATWEVSQLSPDSPKGCSRCVNQISKGILSDWAHSGPQEVQLPSAPRRRSGVVHLLSLPWSPSALGSVEPWEPLCWQCWEDPVSSMLPRSLFHFLP